MTKLLIYACIALCIYYMVGIFAPRTGQRRWFLLALTLLLVVAGLVLTRW